MAEQIDAVDFALAAYRDEGEWQVKELAHDLVADVDTLAQALRRFPGDGGAVGLVAIDEDADLYPDEMLSDVARQLGFGEQFDDAVGLTSA